MNGQFITGAPPPSGPNRRFYPVVRPQPGKPLRCTFLGERLAGYWTHDKPGESQKDFRSVPCYFPHACDGCEEKLKWRWWGFGAVVVEPSQELVVAQITYCGTEQIAKLAGRAKRLRGLTVEIGKASDHASGAFIVAIFDRWCRQALPEAFSIEDSLRRLWHVQALPTYDTEDLPTEGGVPQ